MCFTRYPFCYLLFLLSFISTQLPAQAPTIYWEQYYGGTKVDFSGRLKKTVDNGFVIAGYGQSVDGDLSGTNNGFNDFELIKLDACGNKLWGKAQGYLEASLAVEPSMQARLGLAKVFDETDQTKKAEEQRKLALANIEQEEELNLPVVQP